MIPAAFAARKLRVNLGATPVVRDVDLVVPAGRWTAVVGPNGAGKTTLVKALAHLLSYEGEVLLHGRDARGWRHRERARAQSWLGQNESGAEDLRAYDVVMLGRLPHRAWLAPASAVDASAVEDAMRLTQSWAWRHRPLGSLSGGERQRVLLARALAVRAPLLVMDEPLANLDPPHQSDWLRIVRAHVAAGGTVISVLHEIGMALHADAIVVMDAGRIVHHGECAHAATHRALERVFDDCIVIHPLANRWVALPQESQIETSHVRSA